MLTLRKIFSMPTQPVAVSLLTLFSQRDGVSRFHSAAWFDNDPSCVFCFYGVKLRYKSLPVLRVKKIKILVIKAQMNFAARFISLRDG